MLSKNFKQLGYFSSENLMGMAFIEATKEDQNGIVIFSGANSDLIPEYIDWDELKGYQIVLLQNEIPFETTLRKVCRCSCGYFCYKTRSSNFHSYKERS